MRNSSSRLCGRACREREGGRGGGRFSESLNNNSIAYCKKAPII